MISDTKKPKKIKRDTTAELFYNVLELAKKAGHMNRAEQIIDYTLADSKPIPLSNYCFAFVPQIQYGTSEGIYINCYINGKFTEEEITEYDRESKTGRKVLSSYHIGTIKTLNTGLESMQIMGKLCGTLAYWAGQYIDKNLDRYTPTKELEKEREYYKNKAKQAKER